MHNYTTNNSLNWSDVYFDLVFKDGGGSNFGCSYWVSGRYCMFNYPTSGDTCFGIHNIVSDSTRFNIGGLPLYLVDRF